MTTATFQHPSVRPPVVRLRVGRLVGVIVLAMALIVGGGLWFLHTYGRKLRSTPVETTTTPGWMKQGITYPPEPQKMAQAVDAPPDRSAEILRQLALLQQRLAEQQAAIDALKRKPSTVINQQPAQAAKATTTTPPRPHAPMLFVSHELKDTPAPAVPEYTLAPGATKLPCTVETVVNSDVPGYLTCKVSAHVYDTATGRHLLVPQGSTILGHDNSQDLIYGDTRLNTVSLTLTLPDGRSVDLGRAPITDQAGVAGLTGKVDNHYWRLVGAVFIGGALKGGMSALQAAMTDAAGAGQIATGIGTLGNQATNRVVQPYINIRPTIIVEAGQLAHVLLVKPLSLPAMWQGTSTTASTGRSR
jgi:type IV secretion system protein VirB10